MSLGNQDKPPEFLELSKEREGSWDPGPRHLLTRKFWVMSTDYAFPHTYRRAVQKGTLSDMVTDPLVFQLETLSKMPSQEDEGHES